ncbi:MAG: helix-turn-helix domain-containing protein [Geminicoccaceae bacterium]
MPAVVLLPTGIPSEELRRLAGAEKDARVARRMLALGGASQAEAARQGGMDRQFLRDWAHRFNEEVMESLRDRPHPGRPPFLDKGQMASFRAMSCAALTSRRMV